MTVKYQDVASYTRIADTRCVPNFSELWNNKEKVYNCQNQPEIKFFIFNAVNARKVSTKTFQKLKKINNW